MHQFAGAAATAAMAAHRQGKFWEFHHKLFESSSSLSNEKIQSIARDLKLNMETFNRDLKDPAIQSLISRDMNEGSTGGSAGHPHDLHEWKAGSIAKSFGNRPDNRMQS